MEDKKTSYSAKKKSFPKEEKTRIFQGEMKPLMTEASSMAADKRIHESTELRIYDNNYGRL